jgi:hypothetical protein
MLRTLAFVLALGAPAIAASEPLNESAVGIEVRGDDGTVVGHVTAVERDANGRIVAVEAEGLEPADAPAAPRDLIAEEDPRWVTVNEERENGERPAGGGRTVSR